LYGREIVGHGFTLKMEVMRSPETLVTTLKDYSTLQQKRLLSAATVTIDTLPVDTIIVTITAVIITSKFKLSRYVMQALRGRGI
jgi:hypothetical protein